MRQLSQKRRRRRKSQNPTPADHLGYQPFTQHGRSNLIPAAGGDLGGFQQAVEAADQWRLKPRRGRHPDRTHLTPMEAQIGANQYDCSTFRLEQQQKPDFPPVVQSQHHRACLHQVPFKLRQRKIHRFGFDAQVSGRPFEPVSSLGGHLDRRDGGHRGATCGGVAQARAQC